MTREEITVIERPEVPMIRHIVILKFKNETSAEDVQAIIAGLEALPAKIPQIQSYPVGADLKLVDGNADFGLVADFENAEDFRAYATNPDHLEVIQSAIKPHVASRVAMQYSI